MPIVRISLVAGEKKSVNPKVLQDLADELGRCLGSEPAGTWVMVDHLDRSAYAENETAVPDSVKPAFVSILQYQRPGQDELAKLSAEVASIVASRLGNPRENTHVIFEPDAKGRIAFGGDLVV